MKKAITCLLASFVLLAMMVSAIPTDIRASDMTWTGGVWHRPTLEDRAQKFQELFGGRTEHEFIAELYQKPVKTLPLLDDVVQINLRACGGTNKILVIGKKDCINQGLINCHASCNQPDAKQRCVNGVVARCNYLKFDPVRKV